MSQTNTSLSHSQTTANESTAEKVSDELTVEKKFAIYKQHILTEYLSSRLNSEQPVVKYFNCILNVTYREMCRKQKREEIKQSMVNQINAARCCIRCKDLIVELFNSQLNSYDKLSEHMVGQFFLTKDNLILSFKENLSSLRSQFVQEIETIKECYKHDIIKLAKQKENFIKRLDEQIVCFESKCNDITTKEMFEINAETNNLKFGYEDEKVVFRVECEKRVKQLELEYRNQNESYEKSLLYLRRPEALTRRAEKLHQIIVKDKRAIRRLHEKIREVSENFHRYDDALLFDKRRFLASRIKEYNSYLKYLKSEEKLRKNQLTKLVLDSSKASKTLNEKYEKLKKIFILINICKRQERFQNLEQSNPLGSCNPLQIDLPQLADDSNELNQLLREEINANSIVYNLRNTQVSMEVKSLELKQISLKQKNDSLKQCLKRYFESLKQ